MRLHLISTFIAPLAIAISLLACGDELDKPRTTPGDGNGNGDGNINFDDAPKLDVSDALAVERAYDLSHPNDLVILTFLFMSADEEQPCPVVTTSGSTTEVRGGCTDDNETPDDLSDDMTYSGDYKIVSSVSGTTITMNQWRRSDTDTCGNPGTDVEVFNEITGTISFQGVTSNNNVAGPYQVAVTTTAEKLNDECVAKPVKAQINYSMTSANSGADTDEDGQPDEFITYNGSGAIIVTDESVTPTFDAAWKVDPQNLVHSTIDVATDDSGSDCFEPISGSLPLSADGKVADIVPDAATSCTLEACMPWTVDGVLQANEVCGIAGCVGTGVLPFMWVILPLLWRRKLGKRSI